MNGAVSKVITIIVIILTAEEILPKVEFTVFCPDLNRVFCVSSIIPWILPLTE